MNFLESIKNKTHFKILVKTNKPKTIINSYEKDRDLFLVNLHAQPIDGKANIEIIKFFKKNYKMNVEIISGKTSKEKLIRIL